MCREETLEFAVGGDFVDREDELIHFEVGVAHCHRSHNSQPGNALLGFSPLALV
jgi:hypothetical protein